MLVTDNRQVMTQQTHQ